MGIFICLKIVCLLIAVQEGFSVTKTDDGNEENDDNLEEYINFSKLLDSDSYSGSGNIADIADGNFHDINAKFLVVPDKNHKPQSSKEVWKKYSFDGGGGSKLVSEAAERSLKVENDLNNIKKLFHKQYKNITAVQSNKDKVNRNFHKTERNISNYANKRIVKNSKHSHVQLLVLKPLTLQIDNVTFQHLGNRKGNGTSINKIHKHAHKATQKDTFQKLYVNYDINNGSSIINETKISYNKSDGEKILSDVKNVRLNANIFKLKESKENAAYKRNKQNETAVYLQAALARLRFNNGPSGKVKSGQEFAYLSQCGLYTESQNVSSVQHSWASKIYSPYFYLYEKPKKYEKCKPLAWMNGTDMRGDVFLSFEVKSLRGSTMENNAKICEKYCCKEPRCAAWVLRLQSDATSNCPADSYCCWLKTDVPKMEPHEACVSGIIKREHYKAPPTGMRSSVPLGALGTGSFELRADGTFHEWTVENQSPGGSAKLSKTSLELMLLGVRIKKGKAKPRSAVLRTHAPHGFTGVDSLQYFGSHPVSRLKVDLHKSLRKDIKLNLYAYSAFHPRQPKESATPAVAFTLSISNPSSEEIDVSFMLTLPFGYNDDTIRRGNNFAEVAFTRLVTAADCQKACANKVQCMSWTTNGPFSCMLKDGMPLHSYEFGIISGLKGEWDVKEGVLNCERPGFYPQSGGISLYPVDSGSEVNSFGVANDAHAIWNAFNKTGFVTNTSSINVTGLHGAVSTSTKLKPKESKLLTIILGWYFPHRDIAEERVGNFYNNLFKSSTDVTKHFEGDLLDVIDNVLKWQNTMMPLTSAIEKIPAKIEKEKQPSLKRDKKMKHITCNLTVNGVKTLPECLQDIMLNTLSTLRSGMWMENGRWRQWEAYDCANMDPVHVNFHRVIPYLVFYPGLAKQLMLAWADHQLEDGMIQESLSVGCLEETSKEGVAGGRLMIDVNVGFIVQAYMIYSWTNDTDFFAEIYPFTVRAIKWLMKDSTKGTGLPYRKGDQYDLFELEKYDHSAYNSILYLLGLRTMMKMTMLQKDRETFNSVNSALSRAEKQFDVEMWDERHEFYHAWFDDEWGSPSWLMSDTFYGQVWAFTLGLGNLVDLDKLKKHLKKEQYRNDSPYGLKVISKSRSPVSIEDTSVILGEEVSSCKSLENITKTESIWMTSSTDWSTLQLHLGMTPEDAMEQASKSLDNYRTNLRDQWNFHGVTSSEHYGLDGLPWATSHYTFHLVLWHLPLALSGQQYYAPNGTISFTPRLEAPYWLPFYTPFCMGNIEAKKVTSGEKDEVFYKMTASSGTCDFQEVSISDAKYSGNSITIEEGESIEWSAPYKSKKELVKSILEQLKKH